MTQRIMELFHAYDWPGGYPRVANAVRCSRFFEGDTSLRRSLAYARHAQGCCGVGIDHNIMNAESDD